VSTRLITTADDRIARYVDGDPAGIPDVDLPSICAAQWIADLLSALRPDLPARVVRPGVSSLENRMGTQPSKPLRILTDDAEILAAMTQPHERARSPEEAHVALTLTPSMSRSHCPQPIPEIATLIPGRDEIIDHGRNGLLVEPDDPRGAARLLDLVAKDDALLQRLTDGARTTYDAWPTTEQAERELRAAAEGLGVAPTELEGPPLVPRRKEARDRPVLMRPRLRGLRERLR
jgi:hypothetical protein